MVVEDAPVSAAFSEQTAAAPLQPQHWKSPEPAPVPAQEIAQVRCSGVIKQ